MRSAWDGRAREGRGRRISTIVIICAISRWCARIGLPGAGLISLGRVVWAVEGDRDASEPADDGGPADADAGDGASRTQSGRIDAGAGAEPRAQGSPSPSPSPSQSPSPSSSLSPSPSPTNVQARGQLPSQLRPQSPPSHGPAPSPSPSPSHASAQAPPPSPIYGSSPPSRPSPSLPSSPPRSSSSSSLASSPGDSSDGDARSIVIARRIAAEAPREDRASAATVLTPSDSPRVRDDLGALLLEVPGANVTRRGGFGSLATLSLRGSNPDEVRIYVDGIPLNQAVGGAVDLSTLPLGDVERVEVYRGSTPIAFGESALGGVVSISTRTPGTSYATARAGGGSFSTMFGDVSAGRAWGPLRLYAGVHALRSLGNFPQAPPTVTAGYQPSERENNDLSQMDGVARGAVSLPGRRELRLGLIAIWRDQGLPAEDIFRSSARAATTRLLAHVDYDSRDDLGSSSRLRAVVFGSQLRDAFSDPLHQIVGVATNTHDLTRSLGTRVTAEKVATDWARATGLVEARAEQFQPHNDADKAAVAGYPAARRVATAGVEVDARVAPIGLEILPSARLETSHDVRTGRDMFGAERPPGAPIDRALPILRLGLLRPFEGATLRANIGRYARIPSFLELYGYNRGVLGNPQLDPERGVNADVGASVERHTPGARVLGSLTVFGSEVNDLIAWETFNAQTRAENISHARIWGIELEARARVRRLTLVAQATHTDARDEGDIAATHDRQIPHHPRERGYARAEWRQRLSKAVVASGYLDVDASAGDSTASAYGALPARALVGAGAAATYPRAGMRLAVSALNLGDSHVNDFPDYPLPGRSVFVSLSWSGTGSTNVSSSSSSSIDPEE